LLFVDGFSLNSTFFFVFFFCLFFLFLFRSQRLFFFGCLYFAVFFSTLMLNRWHSNRLSIATIGTLVEVANDGTGAVDQLTLLGDARIETHEVVLTVGLHARRNDSKVERLRQRLIDLRESVGALYDGTIP
jgi:hypothetical protein